MQFPIAYIAISAIFHVPDINIDNTLYDVNEIRVWPEESWVHSAGDSLCLVTVVSFHCVMLIEN